jgi:hypothetical protein
MRPQNDLGSSWLRVSDNYPASRAVCVFRTTLRCVFPKADLTVETFNGVLAIPAENITHLITHPTFTRLIARRISRPAASQRCILTLFAHDSGLSFYPVSFYLAQCAKKKKKSLLGIYFGVKESCYEKFSYENNSAFYGFQRCTINRQSSCSDSCER